MDNYWQKRYAKATPEEVKKLISGLIGVHAELTEVLDQSDVNIPKARTLIKKGLDMINSFQGNSSPKSE